MERPAKPMLGEDAIERSPGGTLDRLESSDHLYRLLAESATDTVTLRSPEGVYRYVSPSATALCGYPLEEIVGRNASDFVHPDDRERVAAELARLFAGEDVVDYEYRVNHRDGELVWAHTTTRALRDPVTGEIAELRTSSRDITERRLREAQLQAATAELELRLRQTAAIAHLGERALEQPDLDQFLADAAATVADVLGVPVRAVVAATGWREGVVGRPLDVEDWLQRLERGDDDRTFLVAVANIVRDAIARRQAEETARHDSLHDPLTGLPNRRLLTDRLAHALARTVRSEARQAVLFLDVDHFKLVNDSLGHDAGDVLLRQLGPRLRDAVRPGDTVARFGGDEFVVLCEDVGDEGAAARIARRLTDALRRPFDIGGREHIASASVGVALTSGTSCTPEEVLRDADTAMYRAKAGGRGRFEIFDSRMRHETLARLELEDDLRKALARNELVLHYQPIHRVDAGCPAIVEALVRWQHPVRGLLAPGAFIAVAEETDLIVPLGAQVLERACAQVARWRAAMPGAQHLALSVNVSARQVAQRTFVGEVLRTLAQTGLPPHALALELTEGVLMHDFEATAQTIDDLRAEGVRIVLDDFGTGYSSLSCLRRFALDVLKIDRLFVTHVHERVEDWVIVEAIMTMAHALGLDVTAEGVETREQMEAVRELGSTHVQGNLIAPPMPAEALEALLRERC